MDEIIFRPKYSGEVYFGGPFLLLIGGILLYFGYKENSIFQLSFGGLSFLMGMYYPFAYPREIIFKSDKIVIKKFLLPRKSLDYQDFSDMSPFTIKFGRYGIPLVYMKNVEKLMSIFQELMDNGKIQIFQIKGELARNEVVASMAGKYSLIPILLVWIIGAVLKFYFKLQIEIPLILFGSPLAVFFGIYFFLKSRSEIK